MTDLKEDVTDAYMTQSAGSLTRNIPKSEFDITRPVSDPDFLISMRKYQDPQELHKLKQFVAKLHEQAQSSSEEDEEYHTCSEESGSNSSDPMPSTHSFHFEYILRKLSSSVSRTGSHYNTVAIETPSSSKIYNQEKCIPERRPSLSDAYDSMCSLPTLVEDQYHHSPGSGSPKLWRDSKSDLRHKRRQHKEMDQTGSYDKPDKTITKIHHLGVPKQKLLGREKDRSSDSSFEEVVSHRAKRNKSQELLHRQSSDTSSLNSIDGIVFDKPPPTQDTRDRCRDPVGKQLYSAIRETERQSRVQTDKTSQSDDTSD